MIRIAAVSSGMLVALFAAGCATTASAPATPEAASDRCVSTAYNAAFQGTDVYNFADIGTLASALRNEENPTGRISDDAMRRVANTVSEQYVGAFMSRYQPCMEDALAAMDGM